MIILFFCIVTLYNNWEVINMTGLSKQSLKVKKTKAKALRYLTSLALFVWVSLLELNLSEAQEVYVISNATIQISIDDVKNAYFGKLSKLDGEKLILLEPPIDNPAKQKFLQEFLGIDVQSYRKIWLTKLMAGETPPQVKSEDEIIKEVSEKKNTIGYVSKKVEDKKIKIITILK